MIPLTQLLIESGNSRGRMRLTHRKKLSELETLQSHVTLQNLMSTVQGHRRYVDPGHPYTNFLSSLILSAQTGSERTLRSSSIIL